MSALQSVVFSDHDTGRDVLGALRGRRERSMLIARSLLSPLKQGASLPLVVAFLATTFLRARKLGSARNGAAGAWHIGVGRVWSELVLGWHHSPTHTPSCAYLVGRRAKGNGRTGGSEICWPLRADHRRDPTIVTWHCILPTQTKMGTRQRDAQQKTDGEHELTTIPPRLSLRPPPARSHPHSHAHASIAVISAA